MTQETEQEVPSEWRSRIVKFEAEADPTSLKPHPDNPRQHPDYQKAAMRAVLGEIGWLDAIKVNVNTGTIVDGHERHEEALAKGSTLPVLWLDLTEEEERKALATFDPLGALATYSPERLGSLIDSVKVDDPIIETMLSDLKLAVTPSYENTGTKGDAQQERAQTVRIVMRVEDVRTVESALARTDLEDRGEALLVLAKAFLEANKVDDAQSEA
jgi:hypothetical protein